MQAAAKILEVHTGAYHSSHDQEPEADEAAVTSQRFTFSYQTASDAAELPVTDDSALMLAISKAFQAPDEQSLILKFFIHEQHQNDGAEPRLDHE